MDKKDKKIQEAEFKTTVAQQGEQIVNLNKGIAGYREEVKASKEAMANFQMEIDSLKKNQTSTEEAPLTPEDQKKLDVWAKKQGYVTKEALETQKVTAQAESLKSIQTQAVSEFLKANPQYDDDIKWTVIQTEFNRYRTPATLEDNKKLLDEVKAKIEGGSRLNSNADARARAKLTAKSRLSLAGGTQPTSDKTDEIEDLMDRYPRLTKEQILEQQAQLKDLYPKKSKK